jgi:hypothetical protein
MPVTVHWITEIQPRESQYGTFDRPSARVKILASLQQSAFKSKPIFSIEDRQNGTAEREKIVDLHCSRIRSPLQVLALLTTNEVGTLRIV